RGLLRGDLAGYWNLLAAWRDYIVVLTLRTGCVEE
ncbi:MAG: hypothetical protein ACI8XZ_005092, partial [Gammaproteobacteria bacterium]